MTFPRLLCFLAFAVCGSSGTADLFFDKYEKRSGRFQADTLTPSGYAIFPELKFRL